MTAIRRLIPALGAVFVAAITLAACGNAVPGNSVAAIDEAGNITRQSFDHWMSIAAASIQNPPTQEQGQKPSEPVVPAPPDFAECVAQKKKAQEAQSEDAEGEDQPAQPRQSGEQLKQQCKQEYEQLRDEVLNLLVTAQWVQAETQERDITVSAKEVDERYKQEKEQGFPEEKDFQEFLDTYGYTVGDLKFQVRLNLLQQKLTESITKGKDKISDEQVRTYYQENKERFAQPERRDLRIVLTEEKAQAERAKAALESGRSWKSVASEFSTDEATKDQGGVLLSVAKGQQEKALDEAVFSAEKGQLQGPVETQFGWYVFQVQKVVKASQQSLEEAAPTIKQLLASQNQQKAFESFAKDFQETWKERTNCREGFVIQLCSNAPEQEEQDTTQQPAPQQPAPQPAPQQAPQQAPAPSEPQR